MKIKPYYISKIYKYSTGAEIPEGAEYLGTVTQTKEYNEFAPHPTILGERGDWIDCWYVWHYFKVLVEIKDENKT